MSDELFLNILRQYWGYDSFRGIQQQIIESIAQGRDTLGLMPTGGGKSVCFQVPTLSMEGLCLVITPLISLMEDQVSRLRQKGIKAETIHAGMMHDDVVRKLDNCILGDYKFLYLSPERLESDLFLAKLPYMRNICMICVDEAHCVSQWGYDFRPAYLQIARLRHRLSYHVPLLALTATATPKVIDDIQEKLEFAEKNVFRMSFERKNLVYVVRTTENKEEELVHILRSVVHGSAIVYTRSRLLTRELSRYLNASGISADNYHAGMTAAERELKQINWTKNRCRVMVATNAFGMGIDKPDVRFVIHYSMPDSIEAYFQEAGRAGRDGNTAYAILLYNPADCKTARMRVGENYPDIAYVRQTYENICYYYQIGEGEGANVTHHFHIDRFCRNFKQFAVPTDSALRLLDNAGYIAYKTDNDMKSRVRFVLDKASLYKLHEGGPDIERLLDALLRNYTGLFADYVLIEETQLSHATGIDSARIYDLLKDLAVRRIIDYIPHNDTPTIMFRRNRVDTRFVCLPPEVYSIRKEEYKKRMEEMVEYAVSATRCRSQMLLRYFGEDSDHQCGQCDVCLRRKKKGVDNILYVRAREAIRGLLADKTWHVVTELNQLDINRDALDEALQAMLAEEELETSKSKIRITGE